MFFLTNVIIVVLVVSHIRSVKHSWFTKYNEKQYEMKEKERICIGHDFKTSEQKINEYLLNTPYNLPARNVCNCVGKDKVCREG